ncbi:hypothetical protein V1478_001456 [Vespula squamosa]|uniref:Uncharacterized protein n=1 Tax=Vespula squamosa TaxID=30214 RepID=A0ABD2C1I7_VESSQ
MEKTAIIWEFRNRIEQSNLVSHIATRKPPKEFPSWFLYVRVLKVIEIYHYHVIRCNRVILKKKKSIGQLITRSHVKFLSS